MLATGSLSILGRTVTVAPDTYLYIEPTKTLEGTAPVWTQGHLQLVAADSATLGSEGGTLGLKSFAATAAEKAAAGGRTGGEGRKASGGDGICRAERADCSPAERRAAKPPAGSRPYRCKG